MGGKSDAPAPPDYRGAAEEQGASSRAVTAAQSFANRPNQFTPWGTSAWTPGSAVDPATGEPVTTWRQDIALTGPQQQALDAQMRIGAERSNLAEGLLGRAGYEVGAPVGWDPLDPNAVGGPTEYRQAAEDATYRRMASRLDPRFEQEQEALESRLYNQGLRPGDEAYDLARGNFDRARTDAYQTAMDAATQAGRAEAESQFGMGLSRRQQALAEAMQRRGWSINEINALLTGQQVGMPSMPGFTAASKSQPTQYLPAANMGHQGALDAYSINAQQQASGLGGLFSMAGQVAPYAFMFSDRRLKTDICRIGTTPGGIPVYSYTIFGRPEVGVMADEVSSSLRRRHPSGFWMVDYSQVK